MTYVLDTNIITAILKGNDQVIKKAQKVIIEGGAVLSERSIFFHKLTYLF